MLFVHVSPCYIIIYRYNCKSRAGKEIANLTACSEKYFSGCLCLSGCRSPPGKNSITKQENVFASRCVYNVGKKGWSKDCNISLSVWDLKSFLRFASLVLFMISMAKEVLVPLNLARYTLPMSQHPNFVNNLKCLISNIPSQARVAVIASHLLSFALCCLYMTLLKLLVLLSSLASLPVLALHMLVFLFSLIW